MPAVPFDWSEYFRLADELGKRPEEAWLRSAISRAYYYVYHLGLARTEANAYRALLGEGTHAQLWRVFSGSPDPNCQRLAVIAVRLKEKRERADYEDYFVRVAEEVPVLLADAREFVELLGKVPPRLPNPRSIRH
jgi:uncharacterized protein (UPF0332 family)